MACMLNCQRVDLYLNRDWSLTHRQKKQYFEWVDERLRDVPIQYIVHTQEFMGLDFYVDHRVLVPRGDTETLVEHVLKYINSLDGEIRVLDLGTGSGAIAVSLAVYHKDVRITAVDLMEKALEVAHINAVRHGVQDRIEFIKGDILAPWVHMGFDRQLFDVLVSNPPYIPSNDINELEIQVKDYEPIEALDGGSDGLSFYRVLAREGPLVLKRNALWAVEVGYDQAFEVRDILENQGCFEDICFIRDLAQINRVVSARTV